MLDGRAEMEKQDYTKKYSEKGMWITPDNHLKGTSP
jgi:hypothetical protein